MNTGKQYSFWQLISSENENTAILIPRIQRDYIQYRTGKVKTNLERFVNKLITTIVVGNCSINLNFIYGNATKKHLSNNLSIDSFNPIDGQQRLTTLFLLHFYIFNEAGSPLKKDLKNSFFYDTRSTTQLFLDTLIDKEIKFYGESSNPSKIIKNSGWYSALWDFDPSVLSCLKVLDQIHTTFKDLHKTLDKELYKTPDWQTLINKLTAKENCPIKFMKLEIEDIDKPNELYIKMNSRGKQLTAFENFKTELYGYLNENPQKFHSDYKQCMDGIWLEFLWGLCEKLGENICEKYTDSFYRELLHWIILNRICCHSDFNSLNDTLKNILDSDNPEIFYLSDYKAAINVDKTVEEEKDVKAVRENVFIEVIQDIYFTMNLLCNLDDNTKQTVTKKLFDLSFEKNTFNSSINQYLQRALLFSVTKYAISSNQDESLNDSDFSSWWRVANNLITNSQIDSLQTYFAAINGINNFEHTTDIQSYLIAQDENLSDIKSYKIIDLPALNSVQCKEEIIKQKIICAQHDIGWKEAIYEAEKQEYFNGEIFFALRLSGVNTSIDATQSTLELFKENWNVIKIIFGEFRNDIDIHRALLIYGDYSKIMSAYTDDYFASYYFNDTKHHNNDWRGMLRDENGLKIFKEMLVEFKSFTSKDFSKFTEEKCKKIKSINDVNFDETKQELHYYLIKDSNLFNFIQSYGRCWLYKNHIRLLRTATRACYISYQLYVIFSNIEVYKSDKFKVKIQEGKGYEGGKGYERDSLKVNNDNYFYKPNEGFYLNDDENIFATSIEDMIKKIQSKYNL